MSAAISFASLSGNVISDDEDENGVPVSLWYVVFIWLETLAMPVRDCEKLFYDDDVMLLVQMYLGELRYAYGQRPKSWLKIEDL